MVLFVKQSEAKISIKQDFLFSKSRSVFEILGGLKTKGKHLSHQPYFTGLLRNTDQNLLVEFDSGVSSTYFIIEISK